MDEQAKKWLFFIAMEKNQNLFADLPPPTGDAAGMMLS